MLERSERILQSHKVDDRSPKHGRDIITQSVTVERGSDSYITVTYVLQGGECVLWGEVRERAAIDVRGRERSRVR